jgi:23S rRNA (cytidine1920-2'-O)/16S rRNA (cytidine1409-2'-O)-methyltransferase
MSKKERLDKIVQLKNSHLTRNQVQGFIMQGKVKVDGVVVTKAGTPVSEAAIIEVDAAVPKYVCRAGFKLEGALDHFKPDITGKIALDAGLSTGGFTDCLLQYGIKKVYGVDVGYGQVHEKIRTDRRVEVIERTNLRHLKKVGEKVDLITLDLSFISVLKVMDAVLSLLKSDGILIVLIKPQFEASRDDVGKGGIIREEEVHAKVIEQVTQGIIDRGFACHGYITSPLTGMDGNKEFLAYFERISS